MEWRRGGDSNSRDGISAYTISNRAPSANSDTSPSDCIGLSLAACLDYQFAYGTSKTVSAAYYKARFEDCFLQNLHMLVKHNFFSIVPISAVDIVS